MPPTKLTRREQATFCTEQLKAAKATARLAGREMSWDEVAETIYGALASRTGDGGPLGDRSVIPPRPEWVTAYSLSIGYPMDGGSWCDSYAQKGWLVGKSKMRDWQSACRNWRQNRWGTGGIALAGAAAPAGKDYTRL